jgi:pimeloyl-ACP methyl ester carboxylesterase
MPNVWPKLRAVAHTIPYDFAVLGDTQRGRALPEDIRAMLTSIRVPTLALVGSKSPAWMQHSMKVVSELVPNTKLSVVPGADHNVSAKAVSPFLMEHFTG